MIRTQKVPPEEKAILVGTSGGRGSHRSPHDSLAELRSLAVTAGLTVVDTVSQKVDRPSPRTYVGQGKVGELAARAAAGGADVTVFDNDLSPGQVRNLEKAVETKVIDRTELILDIFASHARSRQAMLQVELAQLEYALPRLKRMWTHLSRIEGGIGLRGPGEKQLEEDKRLTRNRIADLKNQLREIEKRTERQIAARGDQFKVNLVGYTNAGKSTLMNALTSAGVLVEDKLFSTLETRTRVWRTSGGTKVLLSDTVGFIDHLPHSLVASFHATLEETITADLLIHVVDASHPHAEMQIAAVEAVLTEIGCASKPTVVALNKADRVGDQLALQYLGRCRPDSVVISARTGLGLDSLESKVTGQLRAQRKTVSISCDAADGRLLAFIARHADVLDKEYKDGTVLMTVNIHPRHLPRLTQTKRKTTAKRGGPAADFDFCQMK